MVCFLARIANSLLRIHHEHLHSLLILKLLSVFWLGLAEVLRARYALAAGRGRVERSGRLRSGLEVGFGGYRFAILFVGKLGLRLLDIVILGIVVLIDY